MLHQQEQPYILPLLSDDELSIVYEDAHIIVVNKPSGLLSLPGKHPLNHDSVLSRLQQLWPDAALAHRLDLDTSGLLLAAKNKTIQAQLNKQFAERIVKKRYSALVSGKPSETDLAVLPKQWQQACHFADESIIELPICPDPTQKPKQKICFEKGKYAKTLMRLLQYNAEKDISELSLTPHTGRSHQLRIHCQAIGHPMLGCDLYADKKTFSLYPRLALHACELAFIHPVLDTLVQAYSPAPFSL